MITQLTDLPVQVRIMKDWDPTGKQGPKTPLPDVVTVHTPKEEDAPVRDDKKGKDKEGLQVGPPAAASQQAR